LSEVWLKDYFGYGTFPQAGGRQIEGGNDFGCRILVVFKGAGFDFSFIPSSTRSGCTILGEWPGLPDLLGARAWYANIRPELGERFALAVEATVEALTKHPLQFPLVYRSSRRAGVRRFP
jgi:hypothetical protein